MKVLVLAGLLALTATPTLALDTTSPYAADCKAYADMQATTEKEREQYFHACVVELTRLEVEGESERTLTANQYYNQY